MDTEIRETQETITQNEKQTFTQEDVNRIVSKRVAKYADYEALKAKAAQLDAIEEAQKTELQKATERAEALQARIDALEEAERVRSIRSEVSKSTGVPDHILTGKTKEECEEQAKQILAFAKPTYPNVPDAGEVGTNRKPTTTRDQFAEWFNTNLK